MKHLMSKKIVKENVHGYSCPADSCKGTCKDSCWNTCKDTCFSTCKETSWG